MLGFCRNGRFGGNVDLMGDVECACGWLDPFGVVVSVLDGHFCHLAFIL